MDYDNDLKRTPKDTSRWFAQLADARRKRRRRRDSGEEDSDDDSSDDRSSSLGDSSVDASDADEDPTAMEMAAGPGQEGQASVAPRQGGGGGGGGGTIVLFLLLTVVVGGVGFGLGRHGGLRGQQPYEGVSGSLESGG